MKKAVLVTFSLMTRVIVDENATQEEVVDKARSRIQAKIDNGELHDNLEGIDDDGELPYGEVAEDTEECPVCNRNNTRKDYDSPETMRCCEDCGADYLVDGMEVTLDPRDELSSEEIKQRGYNAL